MSDITTVLNCFNDTHLSIFRFASNAQWLSLYIYDFVVLPVALLPDGQKHGKCLKVPSLLLLSHFFLIQYSR